MEQPIPVDPATVDPAAFDLLGDLPSGTTLLEASAGTGKTHAVGALVARYVAEGHARLEEMLVITFGRAASQELRERVREQLVAAERALADPVAARSRDDVCGLLARVPDAEVARRRARVRAALADFDSATIATTHQFCQLVLRSLGVAGDTDSGAELVDNLDELVVEVVDDVYLRSFGHGTGAPPFKRDEALALARAVVRDPQAAIAATDPGTARDLRASFARTVRAEVDRRKRLRGVLSYDDLLSRLAAALEAEGSPARERMRQRWRIVLVDEFQDTDPVQWAVLDRAFSGHATMVLIGDPKQAIYAFRGGDVVTYLEAADGAASRRTLAVNWRSDGPLVDALGRLLGGATLGDDRIGVRPVEASHAGTRLRGAPEPAPVRVRVLRGEDFSLTRSGTIPIGAAREHIAQDLADDVARLLTSGATFEGADGARPVGAGDVAVLIYSLNHAALFQAALAERGIPSVVSGGSSVLLTEAGTAWLTLLEALDQPHRPGRVRAVALTPFVGHTAEELDAGGEDLTDRTAERVRRWLDLARARGIAAVHEAVVTDGLAARVLARPDGERLLTDLTHLGQVLHEVSHRERLGLPGLLEWLRSERRAAVDSRERTRRLDTDAHAVQLVTIHASKGLQYPVVHLPLVFNKWVPQETVPLFHDESRRRTLDVGGPGSRHTAQAKAEAAGEELRLTYVALTRAQSQVVVWWGATADAGNAGLTRLLMGREPGAGGAPDFVPVPSEADALARLSQWQQHGALHLEASVLRRAAPVPPRGAPPALSVRRFDREVDTEWRRTSYSGLIRAEEQRSTAGVDSEPEVEGTVDEVAGPEDDVAAVVAPPTPDRVGDLPSPMDGLPAGATFGSLVHGVLEHADPQAPDLLAELTARVVEQRRWWSVDAPTDAIAEALLPMQHTSLGPLASGRTLAEIGLGDRLRELDFEFPLAGGEHPLGEVPLRAMAASLRAHLDPADPMRAYADRLESPSLGEQALRGYLSGSIDVVLRVDGRFLVVDYKTNRLGDRLAGVGEPLSALDYTPALMTEAMLHSHYPLQALLYSVVLHRYLRWRLGSAYDAGVHLGGILYLYVRGMCGPETPEVDGQPCGVFAWQPPAALVVELSDLLAGLHVTGRTA
ncbi:exodeoxyribonuclease V subunit beta [Nocardioides korecus]